jgi:hypothetical protein
MPRSGLWLRENETLAHEIGTSEPKTLEFLDFPKPSEPVDMVFSSLLEISIPHLLEDNPEASSLQDNMHLYPILLDSRPGFNQG